MFLATDKRQRILDLALPIIGGMVSQNALNLVDTAMVGRYGDEALAAVGFGSFAFFMAMAILTGLGTGVQTIAARRLGAGREREMARSLNGGLALAVGVGLPMTILLLGSVPELFPILNDDPAVVALAVPYLQIRIFALMGVGMNHSFRGYWNGVNLSKLYMQTLVFMHIANVFLNWVFIFGNLGAPEMGVKGAGLASAIATYVGTGYYLILGARHARGNGFLKGFPARKELGGMLKLAIPAGLQQVFFFLGVLVFMWIVGKIGTPEVAALNVLIQLYLVIILPSIGFGMAAASIVSQEMGQGNKDNAYQWGWDTSSLATSVIGGVAIIGLIWPDFVLGFFLQDPDTLELARLPLQITAASAFVDTVGMVLMNTLLGAGDTRRVLVVAVATQYIFFLPAAYIIGPILGHGLLAVWLAQFAYRALQTGAFVWMWRDRKWTTIEV